jgi:hypothetical protein
MKAKALILRHLQKFGMSPINSAQSLEQASLLMILLK